MLLSRLSCSHWRSIELRIRGGSAGVRIGVLWLPIQVRQDVPRLQHHSNRMMPNGQPRGYSENRNGIPHNIPRSLISRAAEYPDGATLRGADRCLDAPTCEREDYACVVVQNEQLTCSAPHATSRLAACNAACNDNHAT